MRFTVGCVPYVNAIPLAAWFEEQGEESLVRVKYAVPSELPVMLDSGEADAVLGSSIDALLTPGRRMAAGVCIGSDGPVKSVRLFSKVAPRFIQSLALDANSLTSNRLAQIILAERYGSYPQVFAMPPDLASMLQHHDACVLIGDIGMMADGAGLHVLDLGKEWTEHTKKPFVWAAWIGGEGLTPELAGLLTRACRASGCGRFVAPTELTDKTVRRAIDHAGWTEEQVRDYFFQVMVYDMDYRMIDGLREFGKRLQANGFTDCGHFPELVTPETPEALV